MKPIDSQRSRVYAWEKKFYSMKRNKDFTTLTSIQRFLDDVRDDIALSTSPCKAPSLCVRKATLDICHPQKPCRFFPVSLPLCLLSI